MDHSIGVCFPCNTTNSCNMQHITWKCRQSGAKWYVTKQKKGKIVFFPNGVQKNHYYPLPPITMLSFTYNKPNGLTLALLSHHVQHCLGGEGGMVTYQLFLKGVTYVLHRIVRIFMCTSLLWEIKLALKRENNVGHVYIFGKSESWSFQKK